MAFLIAHINFQIRHSFRSRIFFELKISTPLLLFTGYNGLRCDQDAPNQTKWSEAIVLTNSRKISSQHLISPNPKLT